MSHTYKKPTYWEMPSAYPTLARCRDCLSYREAAPDSGHTEGLCLRHRTALAGPQICMGFKPADPKTFPATPWSDRI